MFFFFKCPEQPLITPKIQLDPSLFYKPKPQAHTRNYGRIFLKESPSSNPLFLDKEDTTWNKLIKTIALNGRGPSLRSELQSLIKTTGDSRIQVIIDSCPELF